MYRMRGRKREAQSRTEEKMSKPLVVEPHKRSAHCPPPVAVISDLSGRGRCSLVAAISVLAAMGVTASPVPTALLSAQTGFSDYYMDDYTYGAERIIDNWIRQGITLSGIYVGFLTGGEQICRLYEKILELRRVSGAEFLLVNPIIGDKGKAFPFVDSRMMTYMRRLTEQASAITLNETELCLLSEGEDACRRSSEPESFDEMLWRVGGLTERIRSRGSTSPMILVTGLVDHARQEIVNVLSKRSEDPVLCRASAHAGSYSGTGDVMASVVAGALAQDFCLEDAVRAAGHMISDAVAFSRKMGIEGREGVLYEPFLHYLSGADIGSRHPGRSGAACPGDPSRTAKIHGCRGEK